MGHVLEVGVVLAGESFAEGGGYEDARGKVGVAMEGETVAEEERVWRDVVEEGGVSSLGVFPGGNGGGEGSVS